MFAKISECHVCYFYLEVVIGHFRVAPSLCFNARLSAKPLISKQLFYTHANITLLHKKGFALSLVLKVSSWYSGMVY